MTVNEMKHEAKLAIWKENILDCRTNQIPVSTWCADHGIHVTTYYKWERKIFGGVGSQAVLGGGQGNEFVELPAPKSQSALQCNDGCVAVIHVGAASVEVYPGIDEATLSVIIRAVQSC